MLRIKGGVDLHLFKTTMAVKKIIPLVSFHIVGLIINFLNSLLYLCFLTA